MRNYIKKNLPKDSLPARKSEVAIPPAPTTSTKNIGKSYQKKNKQKQPFSVGEKTQEQPLSPQQEIQPISQDTSSTKLPIFWEGYIFWGGSFFIILLIILPLFRKCGTDTLPQKESEDTQLVYTLNERHHVQFKMIPRGNEAVIAFYNLCYEITCYYEEELTNPDEIQSLRDYLDIKLMVESQNLDTVPTVPSTKSRIWYDIEQGSLRKLTPFDFIEPDTVQKLYNSLILQAKSCYERRHLIIDEIERSSSLYNTKDQLKKSIEILADQSQQLLATEKTLFAMITPKLQQAKSLLIRTEPERQAFDEYQKLLQFRTDVVTEVQNQVATGKIDAKKLEKLLETYKEQYAKVLHTPFKSPIFIENVYSALAWQTVLHDSNLEIMIDELITTRTLNPSDVKKVVSMTKFRDNPYEILNTYGMKDYYRF